MASRGPEVEAHVMGHPKEAQEGHEGQLGACPFSHRILLILEEKAIPYRVNYIDTKNKPEWLTKVNPNGTVPIIKDLTLDQFVLDSDTIADYLEDKYATSEVEAGAKKLLGKYLEVPHPGEAIMPKFMSYLKAEGGGEKEKGELEEQLNAIESVLSNEHPYMGGVDVNAWDMAVGPRLYFARVGCKEIKGWNFVDEYSEIRDYLHRMVGRQSWRNTASYNDDSIVADLKSKLN